MAQEIAKIEGRHTHLAYKPEHAVDLPTGAVVASELHPAVRGLIRQRFPRPWRRPQACLEAVDVAPTAEDPAECRRRDKGYHSRLPS